MLSPSDKILLDKISPATVCIKRFSNTTWDEADRYLHRADCVRDGFKCIYGVPQLINTVTHKDSMLVIEMNNTTNKIMGIGIVENMAYYDKSYKIHENGNYNRFVYKGRFHISRDELIEYGGATVTELVESTEQLLFKGRTNLKRGIGITLISDRRLARDMKEKYCRLAMDILTTTMVA